MGLQPTTSGLWALGSGSSDSGIRVQGERDLNHGLLLTTEDAVRLGGLGNTQKLQFSAISWAQGWNPCRQSEPGSACGSSMECQVQCRAFPERPSTHSPPHSLPRRLAYLWGSGLCSGTPEILRTSRVGSSSCHSSSWSHDLAASLPQPTAHRRGPSGASMFRSSCASWSWWPCLPEPWPGVFSGIMGSGH